MAQLEPLAASDLNINLNYTKEQLDFLNKYKPKLGDLLPSCFEDADFLTMFVKGVKNTDYSKFVVNTAKYLCGDSSADRNFVLVFRRTTLGDKPKPEAFWTSEYGVVRNGLKQEIPLHSEHRILSKIFVTTLSVLDNYPQSQEDSETANKKYGIGSSDGEIRISSKPFNLKENCLFAIKPENEKQEMNELLERKGLQQE